MDERNQKKIKDLDRVLDQEKQALVSGGLDQLAGILKMKETLFDQINAEKNLKKPELVNIQSKIIRNQALLQNAMEGIRTVADRMADLHRVRTGLDTYDSTGQKSQFATRDHSRVEKRA